MVKIRQLSPELKKKAEQELQESEPRVKAGVKLLKEWLATQPHLKVHLDDQFLVAFLRGCKFSLEWAMEKIDKFYTIRTLAPEYFTNRDPTVSPMKDLIERGLYLPLGNVTDPTGPMVVYIHSDYDPSKYSIQDYIKYYFFINDILMYDYDQTNISGLINVIDCKQSSLQHMTSFTPSIAKKSLKALAENGSVPIVGLHFINAPIGFNTIITLFKLFFPATIVRKIHVHSDLESLYKYVPQQNLPTEFGGNAGSIAELTDKWKSLFEKRRDFLIESGNYCSDENLRPGGPITSDSDSNCSVM